MTVPSLPVSRRYSFTATAAARDPVPRAQWPQPCPAPPGTVSLFTADPASWLKAARASYSPRMPITGFPLPWLQVPVKQVGIPATPVSTANPSSRSICSSLAADFTSLKASSA